MHIAHSFRYSVLLKINVLLGKCVFSKLFFSYVRFIKKKKDCLLK